MTDATAGKIPHVLVIMDGVGHREAVEDNAFLAAKRPNLTAIQDKHPHGLISGSGEDVGLPDGQMGNSEVGHMNLGAGRVLYQDFTRITKDIRTGDFFEHEVLVDAVEKAKAAGGAVHLLGLLSEGGVHSHEDHIVAMAELALKRGAQVYLHAFLDGRDTPPKSAQPSLEKLDALFAQYPGQGRIATMIGRYFAMDRDNRWDRVEQAYRLLTEGEAVRTAASAVEGLEQAYAADESDEFVKATRIGELAK
ncbi:MAG: 2,3-bisphosphoglycerate-independent phosphoglycerate mutase, partial [Acinetobacter sp.]